MKITRRQLRRLIRERLQFESFLDPLALAFLSAVDKWADYRSWAADRNVMDDLDMASRSESHQQARSLQDLGYIEIKHLGLDIYRYRLTPEGHSALRRSSI